MDIGYQRSNLIVPCKNFRFFLIQAVGIKTVAVNDGHAVVIGQVRIVALHCFLYKKLEFVAKLVKNHALSAIPAIAFDWPGN